MLMGENVCFFLSFLPDLKLLLEQVLVWRQVYLHTSETWRNIFNMPTTFPLS